jgi:hypothetical protein
MKFLDIVRKCGTISMTVNLELSLEYRMPDADKVHKGLSQRYQVVYQQICESALEPNEIAYSVLEPLKRDLLDFGDAPLMLIDHVVRELNEVSSGPLLVTSSQLDFVQNSDQATRVGQRKRTSSQSAQDLFRTSV